MSRLLLYVVVALSVACTTFNDYYGGEAELVTVQFELDMSRAETSEVIDELVLLLFDGDGAFIDLFTATSMGGSSYSVVLPQSSSSRIIHFVANYDGWASFDEQNSVGFSEDLIIPPLITTQICYWQRAEFEDGIGASSLSTTISLIRNMARFTLENLDDSGLTVVEYSIYNLASMGSVAPYDSDTNSFDMVVTEPEAASLTTSTSFTTGELYTFERENSEASNDQPYIILRGVYDQTQNYYKIDITDENGELCDITRNSSYTIRISSVTSSGYLSLELAQSSTASNSVISSIYPTITDGDYILWVDRTVAAFTSDDEQLLAYATYESMSGVVDNTQIELSLDQDSLCPVVVGELSFDSSTGAIEAQINDVPTDGSLYSAQITVEAGNLSRTIDLFLHAPLNFESISIDPTVVESWQGAEATLSFSIPETASVLLPFNCYITTSHLSSSGDLLDAEVENGIYRYVWHANSVGEQSVEFVTNRSDAAETIFIDADLFAQGSVSYTNEDGELNFSNVVVSPYRVPFGTGESVSLRFTTPTAGSFYVSTSNLTPVEGEINRGLYQCQSSHAGEHTIEFVTNQQNIYETITLSSSGYNDYSVELRNELVCLSGSITYNNGSSLRSSEVYLIIDSEVVAIITTDSSGGYSVAIEGQIGDWLSFEYYRNSNSTYSQSVRITSASMEVNPFLSR